MKIIAEEKLGFIFGRRSVRVYSPGEVSDDLVTKMLEAAMAAPSAMTKDPWRFVVTRNKEKLARMATALPGGKMLPTASLSILVCGDLEVVFDHQLSYLLQDCSAAIENLLLAAQALGLGACWVGIHPSEEAIKRLKEMFELPAPIMPLAAIAIGYPGEELEARTRYREEYIHREKWLS